MTTSSASATVDMVTNPKPLERSRLAVGDEPRILHGAKLPAQILEVEVVHAPGQVAEVHLATVEIVPAALAVAGRAIGPRGSVLARHGDVDADGAAVDVGAVERGDARIRDGLVGDGDEAEAAGPAGVHVRDDGDVGGAVLVEDVGEGVVGHAPAEVAWIVERGMH